jgi:hypothetical protein
MMKNKKNKIYPAKVVEDKNKIRFSYVTLYVIGHGNSMNF